ncbi:MAG: efflux RND transporter periplasmic adaptor subunit [Lentisphaeria bacterium]|nr:efflux RND transporter periplasmic adaptor subunit [Candidatus Neomarinimicrobiota bacterium]MCF7842489.1 efflux RND transporter periplasmic adaptor subunit [Lentisphaeria bacterium]
MKKKIIIAAIVVVVLIIIGAMVMGGGKKNAGLTYDRTANKIVALVTDYTKNPNPTTDESRAFVENVEKLVAQLKKANLSESENVVVPVYTDPIKRGYIAKSLTYVGDVRGKTMVRVFSKVPDRINKFYVDNGDFVNAGDPIAQIEDTKLMEAVNQANAGLNTALAQLMNVQEEFNRAASLYEANAMSKSQFDQIKTQKEVTEEAVNQARAALTSMKSQLGDALIQAPISGVVAGRTLEEGDMVAGQIPLINIYQMDTVKVVVQLSEADVSKVRRGMRSIITTTAHPNHNFEGVVSKVSPVLNPATRTTEAEISVPNPESLLKPGMFGTVKILIEEKNDVLLVSKNDVDTKTNQIQTGTDLRDSKVITTYSVFVVDDSLALYRTIQIGIESDAFYEVLSGLQEGDEVVSIGRTILNDSTLVSVKN